MEIFMSIKYKVKLPKQFVNEIVRKKYVVACVRCGTWLYRFLIFAS